MSLTTTQRDQARYRGGDELKKRKSYLKRSATAIRQLADEATKDWSGMHGVFTEKELNLIRAAGKLVDRATARLDDDIREADSIRTRYDKAVIAAHKQLSTLPRANVDDIVAVLAADSGAGTAIGWLEMDTLRTTRWLRELLHEICSNAITSLSWTCARENRDPAEFTADILRRMPDLKAKNAALITELNALAVAQQLEENK